MSEPLKIRFATDVEGAKQGMANLAASVASNALSMSTALKAANDNVQRLKSALNALSVARAALLPLALAAAGVAAGIAVVGAAVEQANAQLDRFIRLGEGASRAGVGVEFFQRFTEAAKEAKLEVADIEAALLAAGKAVTPKFEQTDQICSRLADLFETGYLGSYQSESVDQYRRAGSNEERIRAAVEAMRELQSLGERLAAIDLAERLFGTEVADRIRSGKLDIEAIAASLDQQRDDLITQAQVQQAQEFRDRLSEAYAEIDKALGVSVNLAATGQDILNAWLGTVEAVAAVTKAMDPLIAKIAEAKKASQDMMGALATSLGAQAINRALFPNQGRTIYSPDDRATTPVPIAAPLPPRRPLDFVVNPEKHGIGVKPTGAKDASETLNAVETYVNGLERSTVALKAEMDALGKSNAKRATAINLAKAEEIAKQNGVKLTEAETQRIREASKLSADYRDKIDEVRDRQAELRSIGQSVLSGVVSDFRNGASAATAFLGVVDRLADRLLDMSVNSLTDAAFGKSGGTQGGALTSIFDSLLKSFGGAKASGGDVAAGKWALVGERGPELIAASATARTVIPNGGVLARADGMAQAPAAGSVSTHVHNYTGQPVETREQQGPQGMRQDIFIGKQLASAITGNPDVQKALRQTYGLRNTGR